jgi:hypothetical protein
LLLTLIAFLAIPALVLSVASTLYCRFIGYRATLCIGFVGVAVHEVGHLVAAKLCFNKIIGFSLFKPSIDGSLGYVSRQYTVRWFSPLTNLLIAMAPLGSGMLAFLLVTYALRPDLLPIMRSLTPHIVGQDAWIVMSFISSIVSSGGFFKTLLWVYLSFSILLFCSPSVSDFKGAVPGIAWVIGALVGANYLFQDGFYGAGTLASMITSFGLMLWILILVLSVLALMVYCVTIAKRTLF